MDGSQIVGVGPRLPTWAKRWLLISGIWVVPGLIQAITIYTAYSLRADPLSLVDALLWRIPEWQVWAIATPVIVWLGRRWPVTCRPWRSLPLHLVLCFVVAFTELVVYFYCGRLIGQEMFLTMDMLDYVPWVLLKTAFFEMLIYAAVLTVDQALAYQRRYREAALRETQLQARLVEAQLDTLKMQLHPHFLFNTINAITVLMRKGESANAIRMLGGLGDLLRRSLTSLRVELVPLDEELDFITRYLDIETTRFPDRLRVAMDIAPEARQAHVPSLILQPIVENAIEHGIAPRVIGGHITIAAHVVDGPTPDDRRLRIVIRDDGIGLNGDRVRSSERATGTSKGHGVGLSHVRKRLAQLYPDHHLFTLEPGDPTGAVATLEIPFEDATEVGAPDAAGGR